MGRVSTGLSKRSTRPGFPVPLGCHLPGVSDRTACRLGDTVFVGFTNLREWMSNPANNVSGVTLVLNGRLMKGLPSRGPDQTYSGLQFDLKRLAGDSPEERENRDAWNVLISQLRRDPWL